MWIDYFFIKVQSFPDLLKIETKAFYAPSVNIDIASLFSLVDFFARQVVKVVFLFGETYTYFPWIKFLSFFADKHLLLLTERALKG